VSDLFIIYVENEYYDKSHNDIFEMYSNDY